MTNITSSQELRISVTRFCASDDFGNSELENDLKVYLDSLQEKPYLLDSVLPDCISLLSNRYLESPKKSDSALKLVYFFCKTRGAKLVQQFLPSGPEKLVPLLDLIETVPPEWTTRYTLLLWLGACIYTPFRLEVLGDGLFERLFEVSARYLSVSGLERDAAALLMARLVTRDSEPRIEAFSNWASQKPLSVGILRAATYIAPKSTIEHDQWLFELAERVTSESATEHRYALKIKGRLAFRNLNFVEEAVSASMEALGSQSTSVRYTAAKTVARIASKLAEEDPEPAWEIQEALLDVFDNNVLADGRLDLVSDHEWHGSLLALAEMLRRSLKMDLERIKNATGKALFFEQKRSTFALGINVRDAACYVCWSLFRYQKVTAQHFDQISSWLISLACFDREVNVRRAAAAALQEGLGRLGFTSAETSLQLMELLNFQSVSQVTRCYLEISPKLQPDYSYLLSHGVLSWDPSMRRLAAQACAKLAVPPSDVAALYSAGNKESQHGVLVALGALKAPSELVEPLLQISDFSSDLICEAVLRGLVCVPSRLDLVTSCLASSDKHTIAAVSDLLLEVKVPRDLLMEWQDKMHLSPAFVVALASQQFQPALEIACSLDDPESRKIAVLALDMSPKSHELVLAALDDYAVDARGDIGSWVRQAAIEWCIEHNFTQSCSKLWRIAAEPLDKLRIEASRALAILFNITFEWNTPDDYFCQLLELGEKTMNSTALLEGFVESCGAIRASQETLTGSLFGAVKYAQRHGTGVLNQLLSIDVRKPNGPTLLATLDKLASHGISFSQTKLLPLAYNGSLNTRNPRRLLPAISLLGNISDSRARNRLVVLLQHPVASARMRAAEALAEQGCDLPVLLRTEWDSQNFTEAVAELKQGLECI